MKYGKIFFSKKKNADSDPEHQLRLMKQGMVYTNWNEGFISFCTVASASENIEFLDF